MTYPLTVDLRSTKNDPVVGATVTIRPESVNTSASGVVATFISGTTDSNGDVVLQVIPSDVDTYYILTAEVGTERLFDPFRFQMPPQATTLTSLIRAAIRSKQTIPAGIRVSFPVGDPVYYTFSNDINIPVAATAYDFGGWVEIWRYTHTDNANALYNIISELNFDPQWDWDNGDRGEIDLQICHRLTDGTIKHILIHHGLIYIRNQERYNDVGFINTSAWAKLAVNEYVDIRARAARQLTTADNKRNITLKATDSSVEYLKVDGLATSSTLVAVNPNQFSGTGGSDDPITLKTPYTPEEKTKLAGIENNATADQDGDELVATLEAQPRTPVDKRLHKDAIQGLTESNVTAIDDLSDVHIVNPSDKQVIQYDHANQQWQNETPNDTALNELTDVDISSPADGDQLTYDTNQWVNTTPHNIPPSLSQITSVLEGADEEHKLRRIALRGETTVEGGTTLPAVDNVPNFTLRVRQDTTADNPALYLTSATYDIPITNRNSVTITVDNNGLYGINPQRGSSTDNYDNFIGTYSAHSRDNTGSVIIAIYHDPNPPTNLYIRGVGGQSGIIAITRSTPGYINGRTYEVFSANVPSSRVASTANTTQTITFYTDSAGTTPYNFKPATEHHSRAWHLQSPVTPDYNTNDPRSPSYIRNKPTPNSIGELIAVTASLPTTATTFTTSDGIGRYAPTLTTTGATVTDGYTVSTNSVIAEQPYPVGQIGWWLRAITGDDELCRLMIPLTPTVAYVNTASILSDTRACGHARMGTSSTLHYYLAYQVHSGNQAQHASTGHPNTDIEVFVAINQATGNVVFPANTIIELRQAVTLDK